MAVAGDWKRVGFVSPNAGDADLATRVLAQAGIHAVSFGRLPDLAAALDEGIGCLILVEEGLLRDEIPALQQALALLPAWFDMPLVVVARDIGAIGDIVAGAFPSSGNVALLERPLSPHALVSAVQVALRASARQREVGELMVQREQAVRQRDEFLAMLAHELRNPLAPMRNALYLLQNANSGEGLMRKCIEILDKQVSHMVRLVDDLLDVARLERGKVALRKERLDLNRVVASAAQTCLPFAREKGHQLKLRLSPRPLHVDADAVRLEQIVCNLVNNASKFSSPPDEIGLEVDEHDGHALVVVEDHGIGFEPLDAQQLFDPFLQVDPTLERNAGGLGLGLTIVKRLVELHGGTVEATSAGRGKGARFAVRLPISCALEEAPPQDLGPPAPHERRSVVVIDDNEDIRATLKILLEMWGHEFSMAGDGPSGLELVLRMRPQVALIDIGLPGMNGYDVARRIRQSAQDWEVRLVAVSGYGQRSDLDMALQAGFDAHLLKPIEPEILRRMLEP